MFDGDPDALLDAESGRWEAFDGLDSWECERYDELGDDSYESLLAQQRDAKGSVGGRREYRFKALTARLALDYYREFDDALPAAPPRGAGPDDPLGIGVWALLHDLLVQCGYGQYDETDIALRMLKNRLKSVADYYGADAARADVRADTRRAGRTRRGVGDVASGDVDGRPLGPLNDARYR